MSDYLSLVADSGQVNTPPGSYDTVKEWIARSFLNQTARVLEVGCSTGFISIEIARYVQAQCFGLDLHANSVAKARRNADPYVENKVSFVNGNAGVLPFNEATFSHTVISGHLPFVPHDMRDQHIDEAVRVTKPWGYLLTALYYYETEPPDTLVDEFNEEVGTQLDPSNDYGYWSDRFRHRRLLLEHESIYDVIPADATRTTLYLEQLHVDTREAWENRLRLFNENGRYLRYFVRVHRVLPGEGKLMIQVPRGGIYTTKKVS